VEDRFENATKLILKREAYAQLPPLLQDAVQKFLAKRVYFLEGKPPLPPASPDGIHYRDEEAEIYLETVKQRLAKGERDKGKLKAFKQGLRSCGAEGKRLIEEIDTKILKR